MRLCFWHAVLSVVMGRLIAATQGGGNFHSPSITASDKQMEDCRQYRLSTLPPLLSIKAEDSVDHAKKKRKARRGVFNVKQSLISLYKGHSPALLNIQLLELVTQDSKNHITDLKLIFLS